MMTEKAADGEPGHKRGVSRPVVCWESGETFPSSSAAAKALGRSDPTNLTAAIKRCSTFAGYHWYYEGQPKPPAELLGKGRTQAIVCWETDEEFGSVRAAAQAVGASSSNISTALSSGGRAGGYHWYRKGDPKPASNAFKGNKPVVCWETGREFNSTTEAAMWAGTTVDRLNKALKARTLEGGYHWYLAGKPKPKAEELDNSRPVVCLETGEVFHNAKKAAEFAGLKDGSSIRRAIGVRTDGRPKSAGGYHWYYVGEPKPEIPEQNLKVRVVCGAGCEKKSNRRPMVCLETGEVFSNAKEAAAVAGLKDASSINKVLRKGHGTAGGFHWYFQGDPKPSVSESKVAKGRPGRSVTCWETGDAYESITKAVEATVGTENRGHISVAARTGAMVGGYHWY